MKRNAYVLWATLLLLTTLSINSCKKDVSRPFAGKVNAQLSFVPNIKGGWVPPNPAPGWYPGTGTGIITGLGPCTTVFNQYATLSNTNQLQIVGASANQFFATQLAAAGITVPDNVTNVYYDSHQNSVWTESIGGVSNPVSPTQIDFKVEHSIVGGTGKFAGANGHCTLTGSYNPTNGQTSFFVSGFIKVE